MKGEQYRPEGAAADVMDWLCNELPDISLFRPCSAPVIAPARKPEKLMGSDSWLENSAKTRRNSAPSRG